MDYSVAEKHAVHEAFEALLEVLDASDREPDGWEEYCLAQSLTAMACGTYRLAAVELQMFSSPRGARADEILQYHYSAPQKFTKERLRYGLTSIRTLAVEEE